MTARLHADDGTKRARFPVSDHCNGKTFFNPRANRNRGFLEILRWQLTADRKAWPKAVDFTPTLIPNDPYVCTWAGHATFLIRFGSLNVLTDPVFSQRASPVGWAGPKRVHPPGIALDALPRIDLVLLSHDHYDHCDLASLRKIAKAHPAARVLVPLGNGDLMAKAGFAPQQVNERDWWESVQIGAATITVTPSQHWSNRLTGTRNGRLWGGFHLRSAEKTVYFVGDTGWEAQTFAEIGQRVAPPDLALIPIGAYEPRWFMADHHCNPAEAVEIHRAVRARRSLGMHWGTFQLTDEGREEPLAALEAARRAAGLGENEFTTLIPGHSAVL